MSLLLTDKETVEGQEMSNVAFGLMPILVDTTASRLAKLKQLK